MTMEKIKPYILPAILLVVAGFVIWFWSKNTEDQNHIERLERNALLNAQEIAYYRNELGERIAQIEAKQYTQKEFKEFEKATLLRIKEISGKVGDVSEYIKFSSRVRDTIRIHTDSTIYIVDKTGKQLDTFPLSYSDKYITMNAAIMPDTTELDYEYRGVYEIVAAWQKPENSGLFARKRLMVDIHAENPKEIITSASAIEVEPPKVKFYDTKAFWATVSYLVGIVTKIFIR